MNPHEPSEAYRREQGEPSEHFTPIPVLFLIFVAVLTLIGFVYMVRYADDEGLLGDQRTPAALAPVAPPAAGGQVAGAPIYASLCAACHQASGLGLPGVFPPLAESEWVKAAPELPIRILLLGVGGAMTVKGQAYSGQMPGFKQLSDAEIAAVLTHIRSAWNNGAGAVSADAVAAVRAALKDRSEPWKGEAELGRPQ